MNLLEVENLTIRIPQHSKAILQNQSLVLNAGERVALSGPSGSGKTLFLRSICLLEPHCDGTIRWKGQKVTSNEVPAYRSKIMYLGQKSVLPRGRVEAAFEEAFRLKVHRGKSWDRGKTVQALRELNRSEDLLKRNTDHLSGGERQIIQVLRAIDLMPEVLCLDEPTSALDSQSALLLETWLEKNFSGAWIWISHQEEQIRRVARTGLIQFGASTC